MLDPEETGEQYHHLSDDERIRVIAYQARRIPIASDDSTILYVDCVPGPRGWVGQVIANYTECDRLVLGDTMTEFREHLRAVVEALRTEAAKPRRSRWLSESPGVRMPCR